MRKVEFVPFRLTEAVDIYSIRIDGKEESELQEFIVTFKDTDDQYLLQDWREIMKYIQTIGIKGAKEYYFRPEGTMKDRICALPIYTTGRSKTHGTLRLYCIRISDKLLILGGGGIKMTAKYEEDELLLEIVRTLQNIDIELVKLEEDGIDLHTTLNNITIMI